MDGECWCKLFGIPGDDVLIHQTKLCGMSLSQVALMRDEYEAHDTLKMAEDLARWKASCSMLQARLDSRDEFLAKMPKREMMRSLALKNALKLISERGWFFRLFKAKSLAHQAISESEKP